MKTVLRGLVGLVAGLNFAVGLGFLFAPAKLSLAFSLSPMGSQGLATLRADFPGFFIGASIFALVAAVRALAAPLLVPLTLLAIAFGGRCLSLAIDGVGPQAIPPMAIEALMLALIGVAYRAFDRAPA